MIIALITIGAICVYGLVLLIIAVIQAPLLNIDEDGFRHEDTTDKLL